MAKKFKDFGSQKDFEKDEVSFALFGEEFNCISRIPGAVLLEFVAVADSGNGAKAAAALLDLIESCVLEEDQERFSALLRDGEKTVELETINAICEWLVETYSERSSRRSSSSSVSRVKTGKSSTVASSTKE